MRFRHLRAAVLVSVLSVAAGACGPSNVDVTKILKIADLTTGWFDAGIVDGKNKLVPSASFTVTNTGTDTLSGLQIYTVFRFLNETEELGSSLLVLRGREALTPGGTSKPLVSRANWGFTSDQPRAQMLMHSMFRDAKVEIFAKFGSANFTKLMEVQLKRQLLTQ
jgi:hypothetical protein